jgi:excisionase family DNA binding protein
MKEPSYPEGDLLDINDAAEYISVSSKTIRRYIQSGKLRARKVRNVWFLSRAELDKLVEREKPAAVAAAAAVPVPAFDPALADEIKQSLAALGERLGERLNDNDEIKQAIESLGERLNNIEGIRNSIASFNERAVDADDIRKSFDLFNERIEEVDKKLFLISQERENQHVRPDLIEKEQEIEFLKTDNVKLIEELQRIKKEIADLKQNGPKDTIILKNKLEENESLKSTIASNERGLALLRREVEQRDLIIKKKDQSIQELKESIRQLEEQAARKSGSKTGLWGGRRQPPPYPYNTAGTPE